METSLLITEHAKERWVERVVDPTRYIHLETCKIQGCKTCSSLLYDIRGILRNPKAKRSIEGRILATYQQSLLTNSYIADVSFLEAVKKKYGDISRFKFLLTGSGMAVLVVSKKPEESFPALLTVMRSDMVDGMVIRTMNKQEMKNVFNRWKYETRHIRD